MYIFEQKPNVYQSTGCFSIYMNIYKLWRKSDWAIIEATYKNRKNGFFWWKLCFVTLSILNTCSLFYKTSFFNINFVMFECFCFVSFLPQQIASSTGFIIGIPPSSELYRVLLVLISMLACPLPLWSSSVSVLSFYSSKTKQLKHGFYNLPYVFHIILWSDIVLIGFIHTCVTFCLFSIKYPLQTCGCWGGYTSKG